MKAICWGWSAMESRRRRKICIRSSDLPWPMWSAGLRPCWGNSPRSLHTPVLLDDVPVFFSITDEQFAAGGNITHRLDIHFDPLDLISAVIADALGTDQAPGIVGIPGQGFLCRPGIDDVVPVHIIDVSIQTITVIHFLPGSDLPLVFHDPG